MREFTLLARRFAGEIAVRVFLGFIGSFSGLYLLGVLLANDVPEWIKSFSWLLTFSRALRALPPWDFALIALSTTIVTAYAQRLLRFFFRRRNTLNLKKVSLAELQSDATAMSNQGRRLLMAARGRLLSRMMLFATAAGSLLGVVVALFLYEYYPSASIIAFVLVFVIYYLHIAVKKWLVTFEKNDAAQQRMAEELRAGGLNQAETEIHVHTERMLLRAKLPVQRFTIVWPMLATVFPLAIGAALIESIMYVASGVDQAFNKLLLVLMALSLRSVFKYVTLAEAVASLSARAIRPDGFDDEDEE